VPSEQVATIGRNWSLAEHRGYQPRLSKRDFQALIVVLFPEVTKVLPITGYHALSLLKAFPRPSPDRRRRVDLFQLLRAQPSALWPPTEKKRWPWRHPREQGAKQRAGRSTPSLRILCDQWSTPRRISRVSLPRIEQLPDHTEPGVERGFKQVPELRPQDVAVLRAMFMGCATLLTNRRSDCYGGMDIQNQRDWLWKGKAQTFQTRKGFVYDDPLT